MVLVGKPEAKRPLRKPRSRWKDILKWILQKQDEVTWTELISLAIGKKFQYHINLSNQ
jgi:hypothetical protein